jgi:hypothetical protein
MSTPLRNIHFAGSSTDHRSPITDHAKPKPAKEERLRLRHITLSPDAEYALRTGEVRPISHELIALILSRKGRADITAKGVVIDRPADIGKRVYYHPDSGVLNDMSYRTRKLFYVFNAQDPTIIHLLDETGTYIESLPEKDTPGALDQVALQKAYAGTQRHIKRMAEHMQRIHKPDSDEALEQAMRNSAAMLKVTQTLPAVDAPAAPEAAPVQGLGRHVKEANSRHIDRRKFLESARSFGRAIPMEAPASRPPSHAFDDTVEDWTASSRHSPAQAPESTVEDWTAPSSPTSSRQHQPTEIESW